MDVGGEGLFEVIDMLGMTVKSVRAQLEEAVGTNASLSARVKQLEGELLAEREAAMRSEGATSAPPAPDDEPSP